MASRYDDQEFLNAFTGGKLTTTHVIAQRVGCKPITANRRLKQLADNGEVEFLDPYPTYTDQTQRNFTVHRTGNQNDPILPE